MKPFKISDVEFTTFWSDTAYWETYYVDDCEIRAGDLVIFHSENYVDLTVNDFGDVHIPEEIRNQNITFISGDVYGRDTDERYTIEEFYKNWCDCVGHDPEPIADVKLTITLPADRAEEVMDVISNMLELANIKHGMDLEG